MKRGVAGLLLASILAPVAVWAAGGAHIVDDSEVETPGVCHVELWTALSMDGNGLGNAAPACTFKALPTFEIGAAYQHLWGPTQNTPLLGPALKLNLQPESTGVGVGIGFNGGVDLQTGDLGLASALMLVTIPITETVKLHLNAGWSYLREVETPNALFYGGQFEVQVRPDLGLMIETFGRAGGTIGAQFGLRLTPNEGPIDFDLLFGSIFDDVNPKFFTFGVTLRF